MKGNRQGFVRVLSGLAVFGTAYAIIVHRLGDLHKGYTWVLVVAGNTIVLLAMGPFIGWKNVMRLFVAFAAAGIPMSFGDIVKGVRALQSAEYTTRKIISSTVDRGLTAAGGSYGDGCKAPGPRRG